MISAKARRGKISRRKREFAFVWHRLTKDPWLFLSWLGRNLERDGECVLFRGSRSRDGYARVSLRKNGERCTVDAHRLFLILQLGEPIPVGYDAGHADGCKHRNCVAHVFKQPFHENAITDAEGEHFGH